MVTRGRWSRDIRHLVGHSAQRLVFRIGGIDYRAPIIVSPLVEPAGLLHLQSVELGFQSGVPGDLPRVSQSVFQAYHILNTGRYRRMWFVMRATLGSRRRQILENDGGKVLNARVYSYLIMQFRIERI